MNTYKITFDSEELAQKFYDKVYDGYNNSLASLQGNVIIVKLYYNPNEVYTRKNKKKYGMTSIN